MGTSPHHEISYLPVNKERKTFLRIAFSIVTDISLFALILEHNKNRTGC